MNELNQVSDIDKKPLSYDINYRAKKEYRNRGFEFLLREIVSNAAHSAIMSTEKPEINLEIQRDKSDNYIISISDNGFGFNNENYEYFTILDKRNETKIQKGFSSFGQGRLALVNFSDDTEYESTYHDNGECYHRKFNFPPINDLFHSESSKPIIEKQDITNAKITISSQEKLKKAHNFFKRFNNSVEFEEWLKSTFFPFLCQKITIKFNYLENETHTISIDEITHIDFSITINDQSYQFTLYEVNSGHTNKRIECFAKKTSAILSDRQKLLYDLEVDKTFYLESAFFDENVDNVGEKIEITEDILAIIQRKINDLLDKKFQSHIEANRKISHRNENQFKKTYPNFAGFLDRNEITNSKNVLTVEKMAKIASEVKSNAEFDYWSNKETKYEDELIKSGLFDYFKHREKILNECKTDFLQHFNEDETNKKQNEEKIHNIIFKRKKEPHLKDDIDVYFEHNLWIIDDKFSLFRSAKSSIKGEALPDIICDGEEANEIAIIELKSSHKAHNEGEMIDQVKEYAKKIYLKDTKIIESSITGTTKANYYGYIVASKSSIEKEVSHLKIKKSWEEKQIPKIPFLEYSYFHDGIFYPTGNTSEAKHIRIELISYEDLVKLAIQRNKPIIDLMYKYKSENS